MISGYLIQIKWSTVVSTAPLMCVYIHKIDHYSGLSNLRCDLQQFRVAIYYSQREIYSCYCPINQCTYNVEYVEQVLRTKQLSQCHEIFVLEIMENAQCTYHFKCLVAVC